MTDFTSRISDLVKQSGGSVNAAAKAIGLPQQTLDRIVRGQHRAPQVKTLQRIADFYGTTVDWLMTGRGDGPSSDQNHLEDRLWQAIAREVADEDTHIYAVLLNLPRSVESAMRIAERSMTPRSKAGADATLAMREERALWSRFFRAWIDHAGIERVRADVKKNLKPFARRFAV